MNNKERFCQFSDRRLNCRLTFKPCGQKKSEPCQIRDLEEERINKNLRRVNR